MKNNLVLLYLALVFVSCSYDVPTGCHPYGVRLALGRSYCSYDNDQIISIWFNTRVQCPDSFVTVERKQSIRKVYCTSRMVSFNNFTSHVHRCSVNFLEKGENYEYNVFGWTGQPSDAIIPFRTDNIKSKINKDDDQIRMLVLADWSYLQFKYNQYDRLDSAFDYLLSSAGDRPNLIFLNGDYAYDFSTNNGLNYDNFLIMLSQIASVWPCVLNTGNHEYKTPQDHMLFKQSFQLYNLTDKNVTSLNFGQFTFVMFDPYGIAYQNASKSYLLHQFKKHMDDSRKNKPIIVASHYPLACSGTAKFCSHIRQMLKQFFQTMIQYDTIIYLGAHYHTYERTYPYTMSGQFKKTLSPYTLTRSTKYLLSIVEGISGNDKAIVSEYKRILDHTAALSYNHTGYGIAKVDSKKLSYKHFRATNWLQPEDSAVIDFSQLFRSALYLRQE